MNSNLYVLVSVLYLLSITECKTGKIISFIINQIRSTNTPLLNCKTDKRTIFSKRALFS